jgi:Basic region leucine zipper
MANNMVPVGNGMEVTDIPKTISPPSLHISSSSYLSTATSAPIPPPPIPSITTTTTLSPPPKRYVRPRATTTEEKQSRFEERKIANRTAAKQSRERQKQAIEDAQRENDRLKEENSQLLSRLANLEQRMQVLESKRPGNKTHQSARPMITEQQCPHSLILSRNTPRFPLSLEQSRIMVYALQILIHSFAISMVYRIRLRNFLTFQSSLRMRRDSTFHKACYRSSLMGSLLGYATPNLYDLCGALRDRLVARGVGKSTLRNRFGKDWLRMVRRRGRRECIRLIVKKKSGKRIYK